MLLPAQARARADQFSHGNFDRRLAITEAAFFKDKAALFPKSVFVVGYDVYELIAKEPEDFELFRRLEVKFAVADRDGKALTEESDLFVRLLDFTPY
jgi:hypothetical protein